MDDLILTGESIEKLGNVKMELKSKFKMKDLGELREFLGVEVARDRTRGRLWMGRKRYVEVILGKFGILESKAVNTPGVCGSEVVDAEEVEEMDNLRSGDTLLKGSLP